MSNINKESAEISSGAKFIRDVLLKAAPVKIFIHFTEGKKTCFREGIIIFLCNFVNAKSKY